VSSLAKYRVYTPNRIVSAIADFVKISAKLKQVINFADRKERD